MRFAHLKTHHRFERMRLRGLSGARDEFHLAAIVQNLKTLANHIWRPPPNYQQPMRRLSVSGVKALVVSAMSSPPNGRWRANDRQKRKVRAPPVSSPTLSTPSTPAMARNC